ncbi:MAG: glycoside hydrolase family 47 protein [Bacteroidetes bacterium]|nr:glycoside hydrolase family 47 protein [Bacteroidota bacterium]
MTLVSPKYYLNPEIMESAYYLYHYTHNKKYLLMGKTFLDDLVKYCRTMSAFAELENIVTKISVK